MGPCLCDKLRCRQPQKSRDPSNSFVGCRHALGLRIADHLDGVFRVAQNPIAALQLVPDGLSDPIFCSQLIQCRQSLA